MKVEKLLVKRLMNTKERNLLIILVYDSSCLLLQTQYVKHIKFEETSEE